MNHYQRMCSSVWGASLAGLRRLYLSKIRPKIQYACSAWYLPHLKRFTKRQLQKLEDLQTECLVQFSGA